MEMIYLCRILSYTENDLPLSQGFNRLSKSNLMYGDKKKSKQICAKKCDKYQEMHIFILQFLFFGNVAFNNQSSAHTN